MPPVQNDRRIHDDLDTPRSVTNQTVIGTITIGRIFRVSLVRIVYFTEVV